MNPLAPVHLPGPPFRRTALSVPETQGTPGPVDRLEVCGRDLPDVLRHTPARETPATQPPSFPAHSSWKSWHQARAALAGRLPEETLRVLDDTWAYALECHGQQMRPNNEPYPIHLLEVVEILVASGVSDCDILQAGMLHDVVEDTPHPLSEICQRFGRGVSELVDWMTKPEAGPGQDAAAVRLAYLRQFEHAPASAAVVKLADRLSNVQRLHTHPRAAKQRSYYQETVEQVMPHAKGFPWFEGQFHRWQEAFAHLAPDAPTPPA